MWWGLKYFVNCSYPYEFLWFMKSLSKSLEATPNLLFSTSVIWVAWWELIQIVYITKGV